MAKSIMKALFYLTKYNTLNDAVQFYLRIISEALTGNQQFDVHQKLQETRLADIVVTYYVKDYFFVNILNPRCITINWFQGILPEESYLWQKNKIRYYIYCFMEWYCLRTSNYNFFVSEAMLRHYQEKYNYKGTNYFIMPCFNAQLKSNLSMKLNRLSFVYIGSLSAWQCLDKTLILFKEISRHLPNATLEILTSNKEEGSQLLKKHMIANAAVNYIPLEELSDYLVKFKYGFLIREDININNVATPNKLSTYMASGVIPIYSDVFEAFKTQLQDINYKIALPKTFELKTCTNQIIDFEMGLNINYQNMHKEYSKFFYEFYNRDQFVFEIRKALIKSSLIEIN